MRNRDLSAPPRRPAGGRGAALLLAVTLLGGCLGAPKIEDRWTRIDLTGSNITPYQAIAPGSTIPIDVNSAITYRSILTGFAVAELRVSDTITSANVALHPDAEREPMAYDIDRILQNSVTAGRATRAVTGWDHLIQRLDLSFTGSVPATMGTSGAAPVGAFLVVYLGSGVEVERPGQADSVIVTPFNSSQYHILPVGLEFAVGGTP